MIRRFLVLSVSFFLINLSSISYGNEKLVIAKNGAGQDLIEHTLPSIAIAVSKGVKVLELHVNVTSDGELILFKDLTLNRMSNVSVTYPRRNREDGGYYIADFTLAEIRQLRVRNVFENDPNALSLGIPTVKETLALIRKLEMTLGHTIGISMEIVEPQFYMDSNLDISSKLIEILQSFGYPTKVKDQVYLQCYDSDELQRINSTIFPGKQVVFPLIQLVRSYDGLVSAPITQGGNKLYDHSWLFTNIGLRLIASYATALAMSETAIFSQEGTPLLSTFIEDAHKYGIKTLVYMSNYSESMPIYASTLPALIDYYNQANLDGVFTDDYLAVQQLNITNAEEEKRRSELPDFFSNLDLTSPTHKMRNSPPPLQNETNSDY